MFSSPAASPRAQRVRKVSAGLRRVSSLLSKSSGKAPRLVATQGWASIADDIDPVLAAARWAAEAATHTPRTAREMMQQCPVDPRHMVAHEPGIEMLKATDERQETVGVSSVDILRCHRSRTPSPPTAQDDGQAAPDVETEAVGCTCDFANGDLRCVHVFEVSDTDDSAGGEPSEFGGSSLSRGCLTLPTAQLKYAQVREHLSAQLGTSLPPDYVFLRDGIPVGKKQESKWKTDENTLVIKAKTAIAQSVDTADISAPATPTHSLYQPARQHDDVIGTAEPAKSKSGALEVTTAPQQEGSEELRIDPEDGEAYPQASFIEVYGYEDGMVAWKRARIVEPLSTSSTQPKLAFGSMATAMGIIIEEQSGLSVVEALQRYPWNVAYGRLIKI